MRHGFIFSGITAAVIALSAPAANASIRYDFTALSAYPDQNESLTGNFSLLEDSYLTFDSMFMMIKSSSLTSCSVKSSLDNSGSCSTYQFLSHNNGGHDVVQFDRVSNIHSGGIGSSWSFALGAFSKTGTYEAEPYDARQAGTLVVTDTNAPVVAVPEPATWTLLLAGCGVIAFALRRRKATNALSA